jgi:hypothetical protein
VRSTLSCPLPGEGVLLLAIIEEFVGWRRDRKVMYSERYFGDLRPADTGLESLVLHLETAETDALGFTTLKMPLIAGELLQCVVYPTVNPSAYGDITTMALLGKIPVN